MITFDEAKELYLATAKHVANEFPNRYATDFPQTLITVRYAQLLENFRAARELFFKQICDANNIEYYPVPKS